MLSIFWAIHVLAPIIVICLFCVFSKLFIATWLDIIFVSNTCLHGMCQMPIRAMEWNMATWHFWWCGRIYFPVINIYHGIFWVTWVKYIWNIPLCSCSPIHKITSLKINVQIPSSFFKSQLVRMGMIKRENLSSAIPSS